MMPLSRRDMAERDACDPLRTARNAFSLPPGVIYLDGNSLGPPTGMTRARITHTVEHEWGRSLVRGWNVHDWIGLPQRVAAVGVLCVSGCW